MGAARRVAFATMVSVLAAPLSGRAQGADDHAMAAELASKLEHDSTHAQVTAAVVAHCKDALERATRLRGSGDEAHAKAADGLAREWAETARDLSRAADAETKAADLRRKAVDAQARLERARALVEDGIARIGRLRAELDEAGRASPKDRTAVEEHDGDRAARKQTEIKEKPVKTTPHGESP
jgi:chromosome segregation ATPase